MSLDKIRDTILILAALCFLWVYASGWVVQNFIEKAQLAQKVQQLESQLAAKAKNDPLGR